MVTTLFKEDEFPINIVDDKKICIGFCMQCPLAIKYDLGINDEGCDQVIESIMKGKDKMKKLVALLAVAVFATPVFAVEETVQQENQKVDNNSSFLGVNFVKQPEEQGGKQLVTNKKSFLFINVVINGKPIVVQEKEAEAK